MLELLQFIMSDIWIFVGTLVLLVVFFDGLTSVVRAARGQDAESVGGRIRGRLGRKDGEAATEAR